MGSTQIKPQPGFQEKFLGSEADIVIGGGAAGAGKSFAAILETARNVGVPGFDAIVFRRSSPELTGAGSVWEESKKLYRFFGGVPRGHRLDWKFPSGATVKFSHLHTEADVNAHQSKSYALIVFEEITHFTEEMFWALVSRNRSTCGIKPYIRATCNPDPDSFVAKLIEWWIDDDGYPILNRSGVVRYFARVEGRLHWADTTQELRVLFGPDIAMKSFTFIAGNLEENKVLMKKDPGYLANLESLPRVLRARLLKGNWKVKPSAGQYFKRSEFDIVDTIPDGMGSACRAWDKAATEPHEGNPDPDWTAGVKMAKLSDGRYIVLHVERFRGRPGKVDRVIRRTAEQDGEACKVGAYCDPGQAGKVDIAAMRKLLEGFTLKELSASKGGGKVTMAGPLSSQVEGGNVMLLRGAWNDCFLDELEAFPGKQHDDQVDAAALAFKLIQRNELVLV